MVICWLTDRLNESYNSDSTIELKSWLIKSRTSFNTISILCTVVIFFSYTRFLIRKSFMTKWFDQLQPYSYMKDRLFFPFQNFYILLKSKLTEIRI